MQKKKIVWMLGFILLGLLFSSVLVLAQANKHLVPQELPGLSNDCNLFFCDLTDSSQCNEGNGFVIWYSFDKNMDFYQFDLNSNTNTHLGTIQNFVIDDATLQQIGDSLYFSCGTSDDEGKLVSSIYSLNLREGTLNTFQSDLKDISPIIGFARKMNEPTLLALEHQISVPKDYIREYGADGSSKVLLTSPTDVRYVKLWSDAENLYILCRKTSNDTETYYIDIFDWNLQKTNTILFTDQQQTDYFNADINDFMINDQFVYIRNFSNKCLIAKRTNNELVTIHEDELLRPISPQSFESGKQQLFFRGRYYSEGGQLLLLSEDGSISEKQLCYNDQYHLVYMLGDETSAIALFQADEYDVEKKTYDSKYYRFELQNADQYYFSCK